MARPGPGSRARLLAVRLAVVAALVALAACERAAPPRPRNLVLISIDTLTPARTSAYGAERDTTPALRALAARGVRFDEAFTTSPWTLPAHAALLTGRCPTSLAPDPNDRRLVHGAPSLAELCRAAGVRTAGFTGAAFMSARDGSTAASRPSPRGPPRMRSGGSSSTAPSRSSSSSTPTWCTRRTATTASSPACRAAASSRTCRTRSDASSSTCGSPEDASSRRRRSAPTCSPSTTAAWRTPTRRSRRSGRRSSGSASPRAAHRARRLNTGARCTTSCCACRSSGTSPGFRTLAARSTRRRA